MKEIKTGEIFYFHSYEVVNRHSSNPALYVIVEDGQGSLDLFHSYLFVFIDPPTGRKEKTTIPENRPFKC